MAAGPGEEIQINSQARILFRVGIRAKQPVAG
jgi:hypothetical protein